MSQLKLKDGTRAHIKMGDSVIGYVTSLTVDATYNIVDANELGNMFPVEQHIMSYKATVNTEFFIDDLTNHRFTQLGTDGKALSTANKYDFKSKQGFGDFLKSGGNRFNIAIYTVETAADLQAFVDQSYTLTEKLLFKIDNLLIQSESIRVQQGQMITASASFVSTDPILNHTALTAV